MKSLEFADHGPFAIPTKKTRSGPELLLDTFWDDGTLATLRKYCGCYVFFVRRAKGELVPQYVGLTRRRFDSEVFNPSNLVKYRNAMSKTGRRTPALFLIVPPHGKGKVSRKFIGELEDFLIQAGSARNSQFRNVKGVPRRKWLIQGVTGRAAGKPPMAARRFREAMGISA